MRVVSLEQAIIHARGHEPRHLTQPWHLAAHVLPPRYLSISISTAHLLPPPHLTPFCVVYRVIALRACIRSASLRMYSTRSGASHPPEADIARVRRYCQRRGYGLESDLLAGVPPHARRLRYPDLEPSPRLDDLLTEIDRGDIGPEWSRLKIAQLRFAFGPGWAGRIPDGEHHPSDDGGPNDLGTVGSDH